MSGVVLANASLDIAFHDTVFIFFFIGLILPSLFFMTKFDMSSFSLSSNNDFCTNGLFDKNNYNEYIKMFWVGLMDGDGSIQVNHWRKKNL